MFKRLSLGDRQCIEILFPSFFFSNFTYGECQLGNFGGKSKKTGGIKEKIRGTSEINSAQSAPDVDQIKTV